MRIDLPVPRRDSNYHIDRPITRDLAALSENLKKYIEGRMEVLSDAQ